VKKLHVTEKKQLDSVVRKIVSNPTIGKMKTGDLAGVQVYKYKRKTQQYLWAYRLNPTKEILTLLALGSHENFYRDLKNE
jgi:mRNA interferase RelE/StbE